MWGYNVSTMALSLFSRRKHNGTLTLLVDIGSASVGAALVVIEKGNAPQVVASMRESISFQEAISSARFLSAMNQALDKVLKTVQENIKDTGNPSHVFCTLSSPWFILKTRDLQVSRRDEFEVTEEALEKFVNEDIARLKEELKETLPPDDIRIIEKNVINIKLNGYEVKNPYKQKTTNMEMSLTVGVSSGRVIQSIERKIFSFFNVKSVHFGVFPVAAFSAIRDIFPHEKKFLFLDVTGEATDVSRAEDDLLMKTLSFTLGKNFFIREISSRQRTIHEEAATLFSMFLRGELGSRERLLVQEIVIQSEKEWIIRFVKVVKTLTENGAIPSKIFFTTDPDVSEFFARVIAKAKANLLIEGEFDVQYLDQHIVSKFVSFQTEVIRDPFIAVEAILAEKLVAQHK